MKGLLGKFFGKKKPVPEVPKEDGFQATGELSKLESPGTAPVAPPVSEEAEPKYDNELLLRGRIGLSTGVAKPVQEDKKEEKKEDTEEEKPEPKYDTLENEYAQQIRLKINKDFDESGG